MFDDKHKVQMRDFLSKKLATSDDGRGVHVGRDEVETVGANMGLSSDEAARLFESIGGDHWRGKYIALGPEGGRGWIGAWVENVP
ncbi:MAG: hypothetical protein M3N45_11485 [Actinomycetota bacterium]|nr:hypothetical protein [Actinomycetota bacterium]